MLASSAKRRKTSLTSSVAVDASNTHSDPSTAKRASFQSPTKSSLARSHPGILSRSPGRSHAVTPVTKGERVRQELLSQKTSEQSNGHSISVPQTPKQRDTLADGRPLPATAASVPLESFSTTISQTFTNPLARSSRGRPALKTRQPQTQLVSQVQRPESRVSNRDLQFKAQDRLRRRNLDVENEEPELPPTPVQLGLESQPQRPRGLASSSPRGSRSSSGSNRRRSRMNATQTSSPLKPRAREHDGDDRQDGIPRADTRSRAPVPEEAPESDAEELVQEDIEISEEIREKRTLHESLSAQLARLKSDLTRLETALDTTSNSPTSLNIDQDFLTLLTTMNPSCALPTPENNTRSPSPILMNPVMNLGANPLPYLTLFAPGNLKLETTLNISMIEGRPHQKHTLTLRAPDPWPKSVFSLKLSVIADVENQQITLVELLDFEPKLSHQVLREWMRKRLQSRLHKYDVGGLVWGIGRWWEACVKRASNWRALERKYIEGNTDREIEDGERTSFNLSKFDPASIKPNDVRSLLVHLDRTSMDILVRGVPKSTRSHDKGARPTMLVSWPFTSVDWTGEVVEESVDLAVTGVRRKGQQSSKAVFDSLIKREGGVVLAVHGVWASLKGIAAS